MGLELGELQNTIGISSKLTSRESSRLAHHAVDWIFIKIPLDFLPNLD
jgi:hypothetical protein